MAILREVFSEGYYKDIETKLYVRMTMHHLSRYIKEPTRCHNNLTFISWLTLNMFRALLCPIVRRTRLYLTLHLVVPGFAGCGRVEPGRCLRPSSTRPQPAKPGTTKCGVKYSLVLLMMGIIMPETCWELINQEINVRLLWHLVGSIIYLHQTSKPIHKYTILSFTKVIQNIC